MINIFAIKSSLAFAPYLADSLITFLQDGTTAARVIRQGGSGLIVRAEDELLLSHRNHEAALTAADALHYDATIQFRRAHYDIARLSAEVIIASVGNSLYLSHPQSELWLEADALSALLAAAAGQAAAGLPDWLNISADGGRLLLSDQRNGRWVLLGSDHIADLRRRLDAIASADAPVRQAAPPTFSIKGVTVHLQSAFKLAEVFRTFAETGEVVAFEEAAPTFSLRATKSSQGLELRDFQNSVGITSREARKWEAILTAELTALQAMQVERGNIRTVFANGGGGRWALQWGDEVFIPDELLAYLQAPQGAQKQSMLAVAAGDEFLAVLEQEGGNCVALTRTEIERLTSK
ncbi:MAG TPA: hypothetical protein VNO70_01415 [Blastocatellia bacterium]|nr:hypothetical protein [Blastocatellia bacterium]